MICSWLCVKWGDDPSEPSVMSLVEYNSMKPRRRINERIPLKNALSTGSSNKDGISNMVSQATSTHAAPTEML